ncbi:MAG: hypothetical protein O7H39_01805 [Gammaproteobacteria bacterium]|nr:hypothetical protein [Gammaproteobacteria bacterium]
MKAASDYDHVSPDVEIHTLESSHGIQQDKPDETNQIMLGWLRRHFPS